jgi:hypothetical protein
VGHLLLSGGDGKMVISDLRTLQEVKTCHPHASTIWSMDMWNSILVTGVSEHVIGWWDGLQAMASQQ